MGSLPSGLGAGRDGSWRQKKWRGAFRSNATVKSYVKGPARAGLHQRGFPSAIGAQDQQEGMAGFRAFDEPFQGVPRCLGAAEENRRILEAEGL